MNLTNQQVAFARVQLEAAGNACSTLSRRAHWQAGVFQLALALECYARELQEHSGIKSPTEPGPNLFARLAEGARAVGKVCVEAEELAALERDPSSWITRLMRWRTSLVGLGLDARRRSVLAETSLNEAEKTKAKKPSTDVIEVVDVSTQDSDGVAFSEQLLKEVIEAFAALVERQREGGAEF